MWGGSWTALEGLRNSVRGLRRLGPLRGGVKGVSTGGGGKQGEGRSLR